ncbi:MAG TPA: diguanylate cyclase response regulator [Roseiflexaceae bacterium]
MDDRPIRIFLVEDNPADVRLLHETLAEVGSVQFIIAQSDRLDEALQRLDNEHFDVMLLDLSLLDSQGLDTLVRAQARAIGVPIVVLTGLDDEAIAVRAVGEGAQDYLLKGQVTSNALVRALRYAIERHQNQSALRQLSLRDDLTDLYNRRGFLALAEEQLKLSQRTGRGLSLLFADVDGLKRINDTCGHQEGSYALIATGRILKAALRESDIIARIGGDEFTALAVEAAGDSAATICARLQTGLDDYNTNNDRGYRLTFSMGVARFDPSSPCSIEELITSADASMYEHKRSKCVARDPLRVAVAPHKSNKRSIRRASSG